MPIDAPNNTTPGNRKANSNGALSGGGGSVNPPNSPADRRNGTMPLSGGASPVNPPNHKFAAGSSKMAQPQSAIEPGKPAIPVSPWDNDGSNAKVKPLPAAAMRR